MIGRISGVSIDALKSMIGYAPTSNAMSQTTVYTAGQPAASSGTPSDDRRYVLRVLDGKVYAVAFKSDCAERPTGWIPTHAIGPFAGDQLAPPAAEQDWTNPKDVSTWNAAHLVNLCDAERQRMIEGVSRVSKAASSTGRVPMQERPVVGQPKPKLAEIRVEAVQVTSDAAAAASAAATIATLP
jgi:hypothetical protein